jgi:hypothetical protein
MKPVKKLDDGSILFPLLVRPQLQLNLANIFMQLRIYRGIGEEPRMFFLTDPGVPYQDSDTNTNYRRFKHLQLWKCKRCSFKNFFNLVLSNGTIARDVERAYNSDQAMHDNKSKRRFPSQKKWLEKMWEIYEASGYGVIEGEEPVSVTLSTDEYAYAYIDQSILNDGPCPAWDAFMSQMEPEGISEQFKAFIWSALDPVNMGRQICYIYDDCASGKTGKSTIARVLSRGVLEQVVGSFNEKVLRNEFGYAMVYGKRFLLCGDNKNPRILQNEELHNITGGDLVSIVYKGEMAFFAQIYARVMIMSNDPPQIDTYRQHETSRIILIRMNSKKCTETSHYQNGVFVGDNSYEERLAKELPHFLYKCRDAYKTYCPTRREIVVPNSYILDASSDDEDLFEQFVNDFLEYGSDYYIESSRVHDMLFNQIPSSNKNNGKIMGNFRVYLENHGVYKTQRNVDGRRPRVYVGIRKKNDTSMLSSSTSESLFDNTPVNMVASGTSTTMQTSDNDIADIDLDLYLDEKVEKAPDDDDDLDLSSIIPEGEE